MPSMYVDDIDGGSAKAAGPDHPRPEEGIGT